MVYIRAHAHAHAHVHDVHGVCMGWWCVHGAGPAVASCGTVGCAPYRRTVHRTLPSEQALPPGVDGILGFDAMRGAGGAIVRGATLTASRPLPPSPRPRPNPSPEPEARPKPRPDANPHSHPASSPCLPRKELDFGAGVLRVHPSRQWVAPRRTAALPFSVRRVSAGELPFLDLRLEGGSTCLVPGVLDTGSPCACVCRAQAAPTVRRSCKDRASKCACHANPMCVPRARHVHAGGSRCRLAAHDGVARGGGRSGAAPRRRER